MTDVPAELKELSATLASIEPVLDVDELRRQVAELERRPRRPTSGTTRRTPSR